LQNSPVFQWSQKYGKKKLSSASVLLEPKGGLGNQLFQYACSYSLARKYELPLYIKPNTKYVFTKEHKDQEKVKLWNKLFQFLDSFDTTTKREFGLSSFNLPLNHWNTVEPDWELDTSKMQELQDEELLNEVEDHTPSPIIPSEQKILKLARGDYCQSESFFLPYINEIKELFSLSPQTLDSLPSHWRSLIDETENSVAVHVRRGDFLTTDDDERKLPLKHYIKGIKYIQEKLKNSSSSSKTPPTFFVFSDEPNKVQEQLSPLIQKESGLRLIFVTDKHTAIQDFALMTRCKHALIGNSTFGWWAAYLIPDHKDKIVVAAQLNLKLYKTPYFQWQYKFLYYPRDWSIFYVPYSYY
jgi:hypothetical protein